MNDRLLEQVRGRLAAAGEPPSEAAVARAVLGVTTGEIVEALSD